MSAVNIDLSPARAVHRLARYASGTPSLVYGERTFTAADTLPRSPSGKLDKLTIRAWAHDQLRR